jgi:hypothetical protein
MLPGLRGFQQAGMPTQGCCKHAQSQAESRPAEVGRNRTTVHVMECPCYANIRERCSQVCAGNDKSKIDDREMWNMMDGDCDNISGERFPNFILKCRERRMVLRTPLLSCPWSCGPWYNTLSRVSSAIASHLHVSRSREASAHYECWVVEISQPVVVLKQPRLVCVVFRY